MFFESTTPGIYLPVWAILVITRYVVGRYVGKLKVHWPFQVLRNSFALICIYFLLKSNGQLLFLVFEAQGTLWWIYFETFRLWLGSLCVHLVWQRPGTSLDTWLTVDSMPTTQACPKNATSPSQTGWVQPHSSLKCECLLSWVEQSPLPFLTSCDHFSGHARAKENRAFLLNSMFNLFIFSWDLSAVHFFPSGINSHAGILPNWKEGVQVGHWSVAVGWEVENKTPALIYASGESGGDDLTNPGFSMGILTTSSWTLLCKKHLKNHPNTFSLLPHHIFTDQIIYSQILWIKKPRIFFRLWSSSFRAI